jgi:hypothetical protein
MIHVTRHLLSRVLIGDGSHLAFAKLKSKHLGIGSCEIRGFALRKTSPSLLYTLSNRTT